MYFTFSLRHPEITLVNKNTLPIRIKYTINNVNFEKVLSISSIKSSRSVTTYITTPIVVGEYCEINLLNLEVDPTVTCPDNQNYSGTISVQANILTDRTNQCKNVAPGFVQPNISGQGTVGLNGYYPCQNTQYNPCFTLPDQMVFYYRKVGDSDWNNYILNAYLNNATVISGLQAGNYEFKRANKQGTSPFCMGPESDVVTVSIN